MVYTISYSYPIRDGKYATGYFNPVKPEELEDKIINIIKHLGDKPGFAMKITGR